jgi:hypothetical protein
MTFCEFTRARWGANWGLCRATPANLARYDRCVTMAEYRLAEADFRREHTADCLRQLAVREIGNIAADLYESLHKLVAMDACNYTAQAMRHEGAFETARTALARTEGRA